MALIRSAPLKRPFYISDSQEVNWKWTDTFHTGLQLLGTKYGISQADMDRVEAAAVVVAAFMLRWSRAVKYLHDCVVCKDAYFNADPDYPQTPVNIPNPPVELAAPAAMPPNILKVFIEVAEAILLKNPSEADRNTLGLVPAEAKPVAPGRKPRPKVSDTNYPQLKYSIQGNIITITVKRGNVFLYKMLHLIVDKEGRGVYVEAGTTNTSSFTISFTLPEGVHIGVWSFKGIFMNGQATVGDWSPELVVPLTQPVQPVQPVVNESLSAAIASVNATEVAGNGQAVA